MALRRLSGLDSAFLAGERPGNPLHVMGILVLDPSTIPGGHRFDAFRDFLARRLHLLPPLRRRLLEVPGGLARPFWVDEPEIDLDLHLRRAAVPSPGGPREVAAMAARMMERPLDRSRPLWEMEIVEGLEGGRIALLAKLHHAMMDGLAGVELMATLFSPTPDAGAPPATPPRADEPVPDRLRLLAGAVPWLARQPWRATRASARSVRSLLRRASQRRSEPEPPALHVARSWFNVQITPHRAVAYQSLQLAGLRAAGEPAGATVTDVLLAVVSGALRRYLAARGVRPAEPLVAAVPVAVRGKRDERANAVTSVTVSLASELADPAARLLQIRDAMATRKRMRGSTLGEDLAAWANVPPPVVFSLLAAAYLDLHLAERFDPICNLVVSSVAGPPRPLHLAGARLLGIHPLGPIYSGMALNVTAISCADSLDIGLVACRGRMPDLWELADGIPEALDELAEAVSAGSAIAGDVRTRG